jgi:hypothetical protein
MFRSITLSLALLASPAIAETAQYESGWRHAHQDICAPFELASLKPFAPQFDNADFMAGWQTAHDDVFETMAAVGIADGIQAWCADPWEFYPEGAGQYRFK